MTEASFVRDCLPEPPTPTSKPEPQGILRIRQIRDRCSSAYLKIFTCKNMAFICIEIIDSLNKSSSYALYTDLNFYRKYSYTRHFSKAFPKLKFAGHCH
jgi:hypothetical protein